MNSPRFRNVRYGYLFLLVCTFFYIVISLCDADGCLQAGFILQIPLSALTFYPFHIVPHATPFTIFSSFVSFSTFRGNIEKCLYT